MWRRIGSGKLSAAAAALSQVLAGPARLISLSLTHTGSEARTMNVWLRPKAGGADGSDDLLVTQKDLPLPAGYQWETSRAVVLEPGDRFVGSASAAGEVEYMICVELLNAK